jgi:hypothetical protein
MQRWLPPAALALGPALALAGCGGDGGKKLYTIAPTQACLAKQQGVTTRAVTKDEDFNAYSATASQRVFLSDNEVTLSFGADVPEADRIAQAYRRFRGKNIGIADVLRPQQNVVELWRSHPSDADLKTVDGCLK